MRALGVTLSSLYLPIRELGWTRSSHHLEEHKGQEKLKSYLKHLLVLVHSLLPLGLWAKSLASVSWGASAPGRNSPRTHDKEEYIISPQWRRQMNGNNIATFLREQKLINVAPLSNNEVALFYKHYPTPFTISLQPSSASDSRFHLIRNRTCPVLSPRYLWLVPVTAFFFLRCFALVAQAQLTATSASRVQAIFLLQPPK